jgi:chaperonin GroEL (HSP60 family)
MSQNLSNTAIIYAILAINSEIDLQKEYLESDEISVEDRNNESEILEELEQALMEFIDLYKLRLKSDKKLPSLDDLLNNPL